MKKYITAFVLIFSLLFIPIKAEALGGYCVIKGQTVYHSSLCSETWGQNIEDMRWYETQEEVEHAGFSPCKYCADMMFDYEEDGNTKWYSTESKIQSALEMERFMGALDAVKLYDEENETSYQEGFEAGREEASSESQLSIEKLEKELEEEKGKTPWAEIVITAFISFFAGSYYKKTKLEANQKEEREKLQNEITSFNKMFYIFNLVAEEANIPLERLGEIMFVNYKKACGLSEAEANKKLKEAKYNFDMR